MAIKKLNQLAGSIDILEKLRMRETVAKAKERRLMEMRY